ncbi:4478_t:CDS:2 [Scutellospora calospora]|uniref:4478_t:CDS:1 n=1 Tax=Scutellospora calospora TaxID=85575 RepID=A0ACA9K0A1_9GLOM|nr:4478_t:CDS:2 [Scutellospora calospora]
METHQNTPNSSKPLYYEVFEPVDENLKIEHAIDGINKFTIKDDDMEEFTVKDDNMEEVNESTGEFIIKDVKMEEINKFTIKDDKTKHVRDLLKKRTKKCPNTVCRCEKRLEFIKNCEQCKYLTKCEVEAPLICNDCLHEVLEREFTNWTSGNLLVNKFIQKAQRSLSYIRYPEWILYSFFTGIECVKRGEFGAAFSAIWIQGAKKHEKLDNKSYYFRSDPCAVVLKTLKDMEQFSFLEKQFRNKYCCNLYGVTKNPSTLEYMLVEPTSLCDRCLPNLLENEFSKWTSGNKQIDAFIQEAQGSSTYLKYPEWIPYSSFTEVEFVNKGGFGYVYSAKWDKGIKCFSTIDGNVYHTRSDPCTVALKQLKGEKNDIQFFLKERLFDYYAQLIDIGGIGRRFLGVGGFRGIITLKNINFSHCQEPKLKRELDNSDNATIIYNIMKWKPDIPIHVDAVYNSRMISISHGTSYVSRQNEMTLQYEICDIP